MTSRSEILSVIFDLGTHGADIYSVVSHYEWSLTLNLTEEERHELHSRVFVELYLRTDSIAAADELGEILSAIYNRWPD